MLVLSRKVSERILVGDDVVVTVVRIGPNSVRLGIEAPKGMKIVREELNSVLASVLGGIAGADGELIVDDVELLGVGELIEA